MKYDQSAVVFPKQGDIPIQNWNFTMYGSVSVSQLLEHLSQAVCTAVSPLLHLICSCECQVMIQTIFINSPFFISFLFLFLIKKSGAEEAAGL